MNHEIEHLKKIQKNKIKVKNSLSKLGKEIY